MQGLFWFTAFLAFLKLSSFPECNTSFVSFGQYWVEVFLEVASLFSTEGIHSELEIVAVLQVTCLLVFWKDSFHLLS